MNQLKFYKYATWALLLLNMAVLAFFLLIKPRPPHRPGSHDFQFKVIQILQLNDQQVTTFKALAQDHNQKMRALNERQQDLLQPYFESLANPSISLDESVIPDQFLELERQKIEVTYQHFQALKSILDEEQLPYFEKFIRQYIDDFLVEGKKNRPGPQ